MSKIHQNWLSMVTAAALATAMIGARPAAVSAQTNTGGDANIVLPRGTVIPVTLNTQLSSNQSMEGETFTATVDQSKSAYRQIMKGATVDGVVRAVRPRNGDAPGTLDLSFTRLHLSSGSSYAISGTPTSLDPKFLKTRSDGVLEAKNTNKDEHLTYAGYGAGAGLLITALTNGKIKVKDSIVGTVIGGLLGYGAGSVLKGPKQVHDVDLKPGTEMGVLLGDDISYAREFQSGSPVQQAVYHHTYIRNGLKYYWTNGREWSLNLANGKRRLVSQRNSSNARSAFKYYTFQGNHYSLNRTTGERVLLR